MDSRHDLRGRYAEFVERTVIIDCWHKQRGFTVCSTASGSVDSVIMWLWLWRRHPTDLGRRSAGSGKWNWLGASLGVGKVASHTRRRRTA